jgi:3-(3-hydroxy-phenyl)propionate hydroxylase
MDVIGRADPAAAARMAGQGVPPPGTQIHFGSKVILDQDYEDSPIPHQFPLYTNLPQWFTEQFLYEALEANENADVRWQSRATGIVQTEDSVTVTVSTPDGEYTLRAPWAVACDGGRSFVRKALGLQLDGVAYDSRYVIVDVEVKGHEATPYRQALFSPPYKTNSTMLQHRGPGEFWRLDYQLDDSEDLDAALEPSAVDPIVRQHLEHMGLHEPEYEILWISSYTPKALTLPSYVHGRIAFVGDAAHLVPIFGGFGMNSAIEDADNLGWKLAMIHHKFADMSLLQTYTGERLGVVRQNFDIIMRSAEIMNPTSPASRSLREALMTLASEGHDRLAKVTMARPSTPGRYGSSPLVREASGDAERSTEFALGRPLANIQVGSGPGSHEPVFLHECLGDYYTLMIRQTPETTGTPALLQRLSKLPYVSVLVLAEGPENTPAPADDQVRVVHGASPAVLGRWMSEGEAVLVRPDGYLAARWTDLETAVESLLSDPPLSAFDPTKSAVMA